MGDNVEAMRKHLPDSSVHLIVTSPPYSDLRDYEGYSWDFGALRKEMKRVLVEKGVVCWVVGDRMKNGGWTLLPERHALAFAEDGWTMHDMVVWRKPYNPMPRMRSYQNVHERIIVACKGKRPRVVSPDKVPSATAGTLRSNGQNYRAKNGKMRSREVPGRTPASRLDGNVWDIGTGHGKTTLDRYAYEHPAMFPEKLAAKCIRSWSSKGDVVLDPFAGSGTTLKMAKIMERRCIGIDISEKYAKLARKRMGDADAAKDVVGMDDPEGLAGRSLFDEEEE